MASSSRSHVINLSANWQALFITATVLGWLSMIVSTVFTFGTDGYINTGTWLFQITTWLLPLVFFAVAYVQLGRYQAAMQRIFVACLASTIGMALYGVLATWEYKIWIAYTFTHPVSANDTSVWSAFGNDWLMMASGVVVFAAGLYVATRLSRR